jgi:anaerobic magnesium-protoporphyrin IX monomethyl ester cyclase
MIYKKVTILNFPKIEIDAPPMAPGLLASICKELSVNYNFIDCNLEFHQKVPNHLKKEILGSYTEFFTSILSVESKEWIDEYYSKLTERCMESDLIAICVFSYHSIQLTYDFLKNHRKNISADIVIGGAGIRTNGIGNFNGSNDFPFYKTCFDEKLIDYWILGEGEVGFKELLTGNKNSNLINNSVFNHLNDFSSVPVPNFDKFYLENYTTNGKIIAPAEGSRGCVKKCTFCDIGQTWGQFKFKNGVDLANELIFLREKYQIDHFWFNDSLVNGSIKAFRDFASTLVTANNNFSWSGQAIVRQASVNDLKDFELLKKSGCSTLAVGIESFSESVRYHMGKKFKDTDLDRFLHLAQEHDIKIVLLLIVGYPTETQQDIDHAFRQLEKYNYLADDGTISFIRIGGTMSLIPGTPIWEKRKDVNVKMTNNKKSGIFWMNENSTLEKRIQWRIELENHARMLGYKCLDKEMHVEDSLLQVFKLIK